MKIWVDDIRTPPASDWQWCKTSAEAILCLEIRAGVGDHKYLTGPIDVMSLDHDLGGDDTTRPVVIWMCENDFWPNKVVCHSQNPVGRYWIESMIERYKNGRM